jgi:hypothetical protein
LEIGALDLAIQLLEDYLSKNFTESLETNEKLLADNSLGYHEFFAVVYRLERQRILHL